MLRVRRKNVQNNRKDFIDTRFYNLIHLKSPERFNFAKHFREIESVTRPNVSKDINKVKKSQMKKRRSTIIFRPDQIFIDDLKRYPKASRECIENIQRELARIGEKYEEKIIREFVKIDLLQDYMNNRIGDTIEGTIEKFYRIVDTKFPKSRDLLIEIWFKYMFMKMMARMTEDEKLIDIISQMKKSIQIQKIKELKKYHFDVYDEIYDYLFHITRKLFEFIENDKCHSHIKPEYTETSSEKYLKEQQGDMVIYELNLVRREFDDENIHNEKFEEYLFDCEQYYDMEVGGGFIMLESEMPQERNEHEMELKALRIYNSSLFYVAYKAVKFLDTFKDRNKVYGMFFDFYTGKVTYCETLENVDRVKKYSDMYLQEIRDYLDNITETRESIVKTLLQFGK